MNGYRPRYTQEQWLQIKPGLYEAVFRDIKPIVRVKAGSRRENADWQMGELVLPKGGMSALTLGALLG